MRKNTVYINDNKIVLTNIKLNWATAIEVFKKLHFLTIIGERKKIKLDLTRIRLIQPNGIIPLISELYRLRQNGINFEIIPPKDEDIQGYSKRMGYLHFLNPNIYEYPSTKHQSFSLHKFQTEDELNDVINMAVEVSLQQLKFADGVPQAFEWVLNELADNVLIHSGSIGWLQVLTNRELHLLTIVVCDPGVGIPFNMHKAYENLNSDVNAIQEAIKKGVTSDPKLGQGNGLAGAVSIAQASNGNLSITSGKGSVRIYEGRVKSSKWFPKYKGTMIFMQFNTEKSIDLPQALWGNTPVSYFETKFENENGELMFKLMDYASNFGNRPTGSRLRCLVMNLLDQNKGHKVCIDMDGVKIIASSFADELFGKLVSEMGVLDFGRFIDIINLEPLCKNIINVAINQRITQGF